MPGVVCLVFGLSGAAALVFEALLFRQAGLTFGNSVWAASLVLSSFMVGLALGNGVAGRAAGRLQRPLRAYAVLELVIAAAGLSIILLFPRLARMLVPVFQPLLEQPVPLNALRLILAFCWMLIPAVAMGMTLPVLVRALLRLDPNFGRVLGRLYGWNTLGAVAGALLAERVFVAAFGVVGAALSAAALNVLAALMSLALARAGALAAAITRPEPPAGRAPVRAPAVLAAAFLCGGTLLALEVVWFRFFLLFSFPSPWLLSQMLAVVLAGIGAGALLAATWFRRRPDAHRHAPLVALASAALIAVLYLLAARAPAIAAWLPGAAGHVYLMFPVACLSGVLFPLLGRALQAAGLEEALATGRVTMVNTIGSAAGSFLGGFVLLPQLGIERSFLLLAGLYVLVAVLLEVAVARGRHLRRPAGLLAAAAATLALVVFPRGALEDVLLAGPSTARARYQIPSGLTVERVREGLTETIQYFRKDLAGAPYYYQMATNSFSMSATALIARRYMKLYAYLPAAVHPRLRRALLISYGVGSTAKALTDLRDLEHIDVVDISRDILELSDVVYPRAADNPLHDPRVRVHVEDGRFFLQASSGHYDLITAEPPPLRASGVVSLYSREYFALLRERLRDGGIVTYWLPVYQVTAAEAKAVARAFFEVFPDGSLWTGGALEWMLVGVKGRLPAVPPERLARPWQDAVVGPELRALGLLEPAQLAALFLADGARLAAWLGQTAPLTDLHPERIAFHDRPVARADLDGYWQFMEPSRTLPGWRDSALRRATWPPADPAQEEFWFATRPLVDVLMEAAGHDLGPHYRELHHCLEEPRLRPYALWAFASDAFAQRLLAARGAAAWPLGELAEDVARHLAAGAVLAGDLARASELLSRCRAARQESAAGVPPELLFLEIYLLRRQEREAEARDLLERLERRSRPEVQRQVRALRQFLDATFGVPAAGG